MSQNQAGYIIEQYQMQPHPEGGLSAAVSSYFVLNAVIRSLRFCCMES